MAGKQTFASLPEEILLCIISSLDPRSMVSLQLTSKHLLALCRDNSSWRRLALLPAATTRYRQLYNSAGGGGGGGTQQPPPPPSPPPLPPPADVHHAINNPSSSSSDQQQYEQQQWYPTLSTRQQARIIANWDTTFPMSREPQRWYDEYIHRHAPVVVNWPQQPTTTTTTTTAAAAGEFAVAAAAGSVPVDVRGLALYRPPAEARAAYAVAPLEDGSVCLWDVKGGSGVSSSSPSSSKRKGAIVAHSKAGLLWEHVPPHSHPRRSTVTDPGILESVAVDDHRGIAFFAIGNVLVELDLAAMRVVSEKPYDFSINTLSVIQPGVPLTVGTTLGLHLNDHRTPSHSLSPYAALPQPGPISIEHLELPSQPGQISDDLLVAGRFSSILHYDRRQFPRIAGSIYSGAKLCSMASLPYSASFVGNEQRKRLGLTEDEIDTVKSEPGRTLITCGEYKSKGSLEIYGLSASSSADLSPSTAAGQQPQQQPIRNRVTAASAKALYVTNHGSRIVYSDGQGFLKWVERDGFTEVRRHKIGQPGRGSAEGTQSSSSLFRSTLVSSDEIAMKLLSTRTAAPGETDTAQAANADDILFWTGDKLGLATFSSKPAFLPEDFLEGMGEAGPNAQEERLYGERMRLALERQAQDVHFVRELGAGALVGGGF